METERVFETLDFCFELTRIVAREDVIVKYFKYLLLSCSRPLSLYSYSHFIFIFPAFFLRVFLSSFISTYIFVQLPPTNLHFSLSIYLFIFLSHFLYLLFACLILFSLPLFSMIYLISIFSVFISLSVPFFPVATFICFPHLPVSIRPKQVHFIVFFSDVAFPSFTSFLQFSFM